MKTTLSILLLLLVFAAKAQPLQPGFDKKEYAELLKITAWQLDTPWTPNANSVPLPERYKLAYRSPTVGLDNRWDLWMSDDRTAVISVRGTTLEAISWLENFYSAMIPANGSLHLSDTQTFDYHLSDDPRATVHVGWTVGLGYMAPGIVAQIQKIHKEGVRKIILMGHSQGAAINYLLTSYLYHLRATGALPADLIFKTYCSAAPKPGNLFYAYSYEQLTAGGWGIMVQNPSDWVPQTPVTVQTTDDFNTVNPFLNVNTSLTKLPFPQDLVLKYLFGRLDKGTRKAQKRFEKNLGHLLYGQLKKTLPQFQEPKYVHSANFVRAGTPIVLKQDEEYHRLFPDTSTNVFVHHLIRPYLYLLNRYPD